MARYKVLKSVAHNFAHSFASVMNYARDDYTMCRLIRRAQLTRIRRLKMDLLARTLGPVELLSPPIVQACTRYAQDFGRLVTASGAALDMIDKAELELRIILARASDSTLKAVNGRAVATLLIQDDRGRVYRGRSTEEYTCAPLRKRAV